MISLNHAIGGNDCLVIIDNRGTSIDNKKRIFRHRWRFDRRNGVYRPRRA